MEAGSPEIFTLCRVPRDEIWYLRYTLEAYEGLCVSTTIPGKGGLVRLVTSREQAQDLERVLAGVSTELALEILERGDACQEPLPENPR